MRLTCALRALTVCSVPHSKHHLTCGCALTNSYLRARAHAQGVHEYEPTRTTAQAHTRHVWHRRGRTSGDIAGVERLELHIMTLL